MRLPELKRLLQTAARCPEETGDLAIYSPSGGVKAAGQSRVSVL